MRIDKNSVLINDNWIFEFFHIFVSYKAQLRCTPVVMVHRNDLHRYTRVLLILEFLGRTLGPLIFVAAR